VKNVKNQICTVVQVNCSQQISKHRKLITIFENSKLCRT